MKPFSLVCWQDTAPVDVQEIQKQALGKSHDALEWAFWLLTCQRLMLTTKDGHNIMSLLCMLRHGVSACRRFILYV